MMVNLYAAGFIGGIVAVCAFVYVAWLDSQLRDARRQVDQLRVQLRVQLAKAVEEREQLRALYLRASGAAWRARP